MERPRYSSRCQICHAERTRIERVRLAGASLDTVAARFSVHPDTSGATCWGI